MARSPSSKRETISSVVSGKSSRDFSKKSVKRSLSVNSSVRAWSLNVKLSVNCSTSSDTLPSLKAANADCRVRTGPLTGLESSSAVSSTSSIVSPTSFSMVRSARAVSRSELLFIFVPLIGAPSYFFVHRTRHGRRSLIPQQCRRKVWVGLNDQQIKAAKGRRLDYQHDLLLPLEEVATVCHVLMTDQARSSG